MAISQEQVDRMVEAVRFADDVFFSASAVRDQSIAALGWINAAGPLAGTEAVDGVAAEAEFVGRVVPHLLSLFEKTEAIRGLYSRFLSPPQPPP